ncbi:MAG: hypothetical protein AAF943_11675 [Pseudomonadota bacterium]
MPIAYLSAAVLSGLTTALLWLYADGSFWGAFLVYVLTGNLVIAGLVAHVAFRIATAPEEEKSATRDDAETPPATKG